MINLDANQNIHYNKTPIELIARLQKSCYKNNQLQICSVELLTQCQLKCIHCLIPQHHNPGLSRETVFNLIDQLADLRCSMIGFSGGEIFLRKDLLDIIRYATKNNLFIRLKTNGALINDAIAKTLADNSIVQIDISLYGPNAKVHDRITGCKGSFNATIKAIRALKKHKLNVNIVITFMKQNAAYFRDISELCHRLGCGITYSTTILPRLDGNLSPLKLMVSTEERAKINRYFHADAGKKHAYLCQTSWSTKIYIFANGDVTPCNLIYEKYGNILNTPLPKILKHPLRDYLSHKISINDIEDCSSCYRSNDCDNCRGLAYLDTKEILGNSRLICYYTNIKDNLRRHHEKTKEKNKENKILHCQD